MSKLLLTNLTLFLDDAGDIITEPAQAKALAEYLAAIVLMSSYPNSERPTEFINVQDTNLVVVKYLGLSSPTQTILCGCALNATTVD